MSEKQKFQEIIQELRSDLTYLGELQDKLKWEVIDNGDILCNTFAGRQRIPEIETWVVDVYIDKLLETDSKIGLFLRQMGIKQKPKLVLRTNKRLFTTHCTQYRQVII